jgi:hypothetical protein
VRIFLTSPRFLFTSTHFLFQFCSCTCSIGGSLEYRQLAGLVRASRLCPSVSAASSTFFPRTLLPLPAAAPQPAAARPPARRTWSRVPHRDSRHDPNAPTNLTCGPPRHHPFPEFPTKISRHRPLPPAKTSRPRHTSPPATPWPTAQRDEGVRFAAQATPRDIKTRRAP